MTSPRPLPWAIAAGSLTAGLLAFIQFELDRPMLILERFVEGAGWLQVAAVALYAGGLTFAMADPRRAPIWRRRAWALLSAAFFGQLALGAAGIDRFLMSGDLHLPVPGVALAGPLYRGETTFMLFLLAAAVVIIGPAWCSHVCYLGSWDDALSRRRRRPTPLPRHRRWIQAGIFVAVMGTALAFNLLGIAGSVATSLGLAFGLFGVVTMLALSTRTGAMVHCVVYCPLGLVTTTLGRISPFRLHMDSSCDACGACRAACRYDALSDDDIRRGRPAPSCTLCGDCVRTCKHGSLHYRFPLLGRHASRMLFLTLVVTFHATTLGVAMI